MSRFETNKIQRDDCRTQGPGTSTFRRCGDFRVCPSVTGMFYDLCISDQAK